MGTTTTTTCDRCGGVGGQSWEHKVIQLSVVLPIDSVNGGVAKWDLCRDCRQDFWAMMHGFMSDWRPAVDNGGDVRQ